MQTYMTLTEVAKMLQIHPATVNRYCKKRMLTFYQFGNRKKFLREDIERYIKGAAQNVTKESADPFNIS